MTPRLISMMLAFGLGVVWVVAGFGAALLVAVLTALGWLIGGVIEGKINLVTLWEDLQGRRRELL
jgi:hypothetical protein